MKKKIIALCVCIAMLAIALIGGTMAYFTDTDQAENVFTVGNIDIDLHEYKADGTTPFEEVNNIMPGMTYGKIVNVENTGKNDAYVRVKIIIPENMIPTWNSDAVGVSGSGKEWEANVSTEDALNTFGEFVFVRNAKLGLDNKDTEDVKENITSALLKAVTLNASVTELNVSDTYKVIVNAEAIQADSFDSADKAFEALDDSNSSNVASKVDASNVDELNAALGSAQLVQMTNNVTSENDIKMAAGAVLDGNGNTLTKTKDAEGTVNAGIDTQGGTVKNITVTGDTFNDKGFRAVYATNGISEDLVIDGATLSGTYALNITGASPEKTLTVKNSTLNGWTSYAPLANAKFENVTFGTAEGYHNLKPYANTVLNNCKFDAAFVMDAGAAVTINLNNCTVNDTAVTAENFKRLFTLDSADKLFECTIVVNGTTVALN